MSLIESGTNVIYFGGAWCPNCQAALPYINEVALEMGITVYNFDTRINGETSEYDIRSCLNDNDLNLYDNLIDALGYVNPNGTVVSIDGTYVLDKDGNTIPRMPVPTVVVVKDGKLLDSLTREYIYDPELNVLGFSDENFEVDYSESYRAELRELFDLAL